MNFDDDKPTLLEQLAIEQQQLQIEMAESTAKLERIRREEAAAAYLSQQEQARADTVTKCYVPPAPRRSAPAPDWSNYINTRVRQGDQRITKILSEAVGETLADLRAKLRAEFQAELERQIAAVRIEFLQQQLDATRSVTRLKPVPDKGSMIG